MVAFRTRILLTYCLSLISPSGTYFAARDIIWRRKARPAPEALGVRRLERVFAVAAFLAAKLARERSKAWPTFLAGVARARFYGESELTCLAAFPVTAAEFTVDAAFTAVLQVCAMRIVCTRCTKFARSHRVGRRKALAARVAGCRVIGITVFAQKTIITIVLQVVVCIIVLADRARNAGGRRSGGIETLCAFFTL